MQLDQRVVSGLKPHSPTNDSPYFGYEMESTSSSRPLGKRQRTTKTMQESLGIEPMDSMAKSQPIWKRLYMQWSKQLLQI
jgi:hypothetical protein